jgi:hypothetical protein
MACKPGKCSVRCGDKITIKGLRDMGANLEDADIVFASDIRKIDIPSITRIESHLSSIETQLEEVHDTLACRQDSAKDNCLVCILKSELRSIRAILEKTKEKGK